MDLETLLKEAKITRAELARQLKLHPTTVSKWGRKPPGYAIAYLILLAKYYRIVPSPLE